jgi:hypothetical protein
VKKAVFGGRNSDIGEGRSSVQSLGHGHEPDVRKKHLGDGIHPFGELGWIEVNRRVCSVAMALEGRWRWW